jgi:CDP-paratose 2-epimerase
MNERVLVTGGAGFVGSSIALEMKARHPAWEVTAFDNLRRRGSELGLPRLSLGGVRFVHGDVRAPEDLEDLPPQTIVIDCAAEPSVLAGLGHAASPSYVLDTNLKGTLHALERARRWGAGFVLLSTSRVYPVTPLEALPFVETPTRFDLASAAESTSGRGWSTEGITEWFPLEGARSMYGATKLCAELLVAEYVAAYGMRAVIDRCGVIAGPWQMGKVDQGIVSHWVASHLVGKPLRYIGYGGKGKQVRDVLHVADLVRLIDLQVAEMDALRGEVFNVGGGRGCSTSLLELTMHCRRETSRTVPIDSEAETRAADIRIYLTDASKVKKRFGWAVEKTIEDVVGDIARWMRDEPALVERMFA